MAQVHVMARARRGDRTGVTGWRAMRRKGVAGASIDEDSIYIGVGAVVCCATPRANPARVLSQHFCVELNGQEFLRRMAQGKKKNGRVSPATFPSRLWATISRQSPSPNRPRRLRIAGRGDVRPPPRSYPSAPRRTFREGRRFCPRRLSFAPWWRLSSKRQR